MLAVFRETLMLKVPVIREHVQGRAPREDKLEDFLGPYLDQVRCTKENGFLQHHMIKKATTHVGYAEGNNFYVHFKNNLFLIYRVFDKVKSRSAHMKSHVVKPGGK